MFFFDFIGPWNSPARPSGPSPPRTRRARSLWFSIFESILKKKFAYKKILQLYDMATSNLGRQIKAELYIQLQMKLHGLIIRYSNGAVCKQVASRSGFATKTESTLVQRALVIINPELFCFKRVSKLRLTSHNTCRAELYQILEQGE